LANCSSGFGLVGYRLSKLTSRLAVPTTAPYTEGWLTKTEAMYVLFNNFAVRQKSLNCHLAKLIVNHARECRTFQFLNYY